jgi:membrane fusion protein (multidrug efflux system)
MQKSLYGGQKNDFERYKNLYENHSITTQQYEEALAAKQAAEQNLKILASQQKASISKRNAASSQSEISVKQIAVAKAKAQSAKAQVDAALLNMRYTVITAPINGQLSNVDLQVGQFVQAGQSLFYLVDTTSKWVVANFKETQLEKMKIGQSVNIRVDAYPDETFTGKVTAFSPATGAKFSLLPPDNASGNFVKTIQRLPVKIDFAAQEDLSSFKKLRSGMNVIVDVHLN